MKIGLISFLEPGLAAVKRDLIASENERMIATFFAEKPQFLQASLALEHDALRAELLRLCDVEKCALVLTLGGNGPRAEDITPEVTREVIERELPGFGEIMRQYSYEMNRVSLVSRATAGVRGQSLIINLPSRPKPVKFCLKLVREGLAETVGQLTGNAPVLSEDVIRIPAEKFLPFLKRFRVKPDPREK